MCQPVVVGGTQDDVEIDDAPSRSRPWLQGAVLGLPLVLFAAAAWAHRNVIDDGFIYLRIVHQVLAGHGPVFNTGERVEAFTSPLWLAILAVADALTPIRLEWLAVVLGIVATLAGLVLAMIGAAKLSRLTDKNAFLIPFGVIVLVVLIPMWFYASSGLETGIAFLWLGAALWVLATWSVSSSRLPWWGALILGLGWLVRPELALYTIAFLVTVLCLQRGDSWGARLRLLAIALALPAAYQLFRMGYYGALVANTAVDKEATTMRWVRGWRYFIDFIRPYGLVVPLVLLAAGGWVPLALRLRRGGDSRGLGIVVAIVAAGLLNGLYVVAIGGDYEHARLFLPALFALCAPVAVIPFARAHAIALGLVPWAFLAFISLRPPATKPGVNFALPQAGLVTTNDLGLGPGDDAATGVANADVLYQKDFKSLKSVELPLAAGVPRPIAVVEGIGVGPYALGTHLQVFDLLGLADPVTSHLENGKWTGVLPYPGHEKQLPRPWIAARLAPSDTTVDPNRLPDIAFPRIAQTTGAAFQQQVADARAALSCAPIKRLERSADAPLTVGRFLRNIVDSFSNTSLRFSPNPEIALRELCGGKTSAMAMTSPTGPTPAPTVEAADASRSAAIVTTPAATGLPPAQVREDDRPAPVVAVSGFV